MSSPRESLEKAGGGEGGNRPEARILEKREGVSNLIINPGNMTNRNVRVVLHEYEDKKTKTVHDTWGL